MTVTMWTVMRIWTRMTVFFQRMMKKKATTVEVISIAYIMFDN
jgi:hypothetical protein